MKYDEGIDLMLKGVKGFHGKFKKVFGQMALRLDDDAYLVSNGSLMLAGIMEDDVLVSDMGDGHPGQCFSAMPWVNAIIYGCSPDTVAVSEKYEEMPVALDDLAQIAGAYVPVIDEATPEKMAAALENSSVCLVKSSGFYAAASNMRKAVAAAQIVQKACEALVHGEMIGGARPMNAEVSAKLKAEFEDEYVETNQAETVEYIGYDEETFAMRNSLIETGKNLVREDLVYGAWGNLSVRVNEDRMLITPSSMDYFEIKIEDIVDVDIHTMDFGEQRVPSSDALIHAEMYKKIPGCNAIIHTHSNAMSVFAACEAGFVINDPNMKNLIGDIRVIPFAENASEELADNVVATMEETHAAVLSHHGAIFYGPSLEVAYKIAEAVELTARKLLKYDWRPEDEEE